MADNNDNNGCNAATNANPYNAHEHDFVRMRYRLKHRVMDWELFNAHWDTPILNIHPPEQLLYIEQAPSKVQKLWKKVTRIHAPRWNAKINEIGQRLSCKMSKAPQGKPICRQVVAQCSKIIDEIYKRLPIQYSATTILTDLELIQKTHHGPSFKWFHRQSVTYILRWALQLRANAFVYLGEHIPAISDTERARHMHPPFEELPTCYSLFTRVIRASRLEKAGLLNEALLDYRVAAAGIRLMVHNNKRHIKYFSENCGGDVRLKIVELTIRIKRKEGKVRPLFNFEERDSLMMELGLGPYDWKAYKCQNCGKTRRQTRLFLCSGCCTTWFCDNACSLQGWRNGHKEMCRRTHITLYGTTECKVYELMTENGGCALLTDSGVSFFICRLCFDVDANEYFDALTDLPITFRDGEKRDIDG